MQNGKDQHKAVGQLSLNVAEHIQELVQAFYDLPGHVPNPERVVLLMEAVSLLKVTGWALINQKIPPKPGLVDTDIPF